MGCAGSFFEDSQLSRERQEKGERESSENLPEFKKGDASKTSQNNCTALLIELIEPIENRVHQHRYHYYQGVIIRY